MADTKSHHAQPVGPVEGDGISYSGIVWFVVILTVTTLACQLIVWGLFEVIENREVGRDVSRAPLSEPAAAPVIKDGHVYLSVTDGFFQCYELASGKLVSEERLPTTAASGQTWGSPVLAGDKLYILNQSGETLILRASPRFEVIGKNPIGEKSNSTLALSNGEIFLRTHNALYCIGDAKAAAR